MTVASARPWRRAIAWLAFLGPFFFASYGFATWWTARRQDVGAVVFEWERHVPFVPWTIVPYWSIDVFYAISLFVCTTARELDAHARRLLTAQIVAVTCFLAFPLRFTFTRPPAEGIPGALFEILGSFDQPFNQAPSLHIALLVILWALYARHTRGVARWLVHAWGALIGVSVLTTWQHHFVDVPTGALLGFFCLWLWPLERPSPLASMQWSRDPRRRQLALRYGLGAAVVAVLAVVTGGFALWLLWPAVACTLVACNYAALGPGGFQKDARGAISPGASALLLPYLVAASINARWWTRGQSQAVLIQDDVWLGRLPRRGEQAGAKFAAIVDMTAELPFDPGGRAYTSLPVLDLVAADATTLSRAARAIEDARRSGPVLVCCALGFSRSASAVAAWLVASGRASDPEAAIAQVRAARPRVVLGDAHRAELVAASTALAR
jgi:protein-tyrosine phosphatase/membrane-associated phospholipid phosphatase